MIYIFSATTIPLCGSPFVSLPKSFTAVSYHVLQFRLSANKMSLIHHFSCFRDNNLINEELQTLQVDLRFWNLFFAFFDPNLLVCNYCLYYHFLVSCWILVPRSLPQLFILLRWCIKPWRCLRLTRHLWI